MNQIEVSMDGLSVMLGTPSGRRPTWGYAIAFADTLAALTKMRIDYKVNVVTGNAIITKARDEVVDDFLKSDCNRLFWIDDDIAWEPADFVRLLALSKEYEVVGAAYPARREPTTYFVKAADITNIPLNEMGLCELEGWGLGFTVMTRRVVEDVAITKPRYRDSGDGREMASVFRTDTLNGNFRGEDMAFFADIRALGYKAWLDPSIELGHGGDKEFRGRFKDAFQLTESQLVA